MKNFHRVLVVLLVLISLSIIIDKQIGGFINSYNERVNRLSKLVGTFGLESQKDFLKSAGINISNGIDVPDRTPDSRFWQGRIMDWNGRYLYMRSDGKVAAKKKD